MLFNSLNFVWFFPLVVAIYFVTSPKYRWAILLIASYYFYMCWRVDYILLIVVSTLIDYFCGIQMSKLEGKNRRKPFLILSLLVNLGILFFFKYFNFFSESFRTVFDYYNIFYGVATFDVLLPVGISFYTFQTLSYSIDVYNGKIKAEKHLGIFALYVSFFPQLVAGPIERSSHLLPQFHQKYDFDYKRVVSGLSLMLWGFFKKIVIADRLAIYVNEVYNNPESYEGGSVILATYFFAFQIYCDFSGYSDIAIGAARTMGYDLMENFKRPYFSKSIKEFWQRWHISLSTWFRDYVYIPLGGNRTLKWRWYYNLFITFLISGLWHGANWTFIIWGAIHGIYLILALVFAEYNSKLSKKLQLDKYKWLSRTINVFITFHLVVFAWIFFRANSLSDAYTLIHNIFSLKFSSLININILRNKLELILSIFFILFLITIHFLERKEKLSELIKKQNLLIRWSIYMFFVLTIFLFGIHSTGDEFIYFQF